MKNEKSSGRAAALLNQALDVALRAESAPASPVKTFLQADARREFRRCAQRLRAGKVRPRYKDRYTAEELADIYERAVQHDEMLEQAWNDFERISLELGRVLAENDPEERKNLDATLDEIARSAETNGPGSEAARRYQHLQMLACLGEQGHSRERRQRPHASRRTPPAPTPIPAVEPAGAETFPPPLGSGELVVAMRPKGRESERARVFLRIQTLAGGLTSIGTAERGYESLSVIYEMPDGNRLFRTTEGVGYIIDVASRTLVEDIGSDIVQVSRDEDLTLLFVYHGDGSLEAFGKSGRLWKTASLGSGEFRNMSLLNNAFVAEARQTSGEEWVGFSVDVATGDVRYAGRDDGMTG